MIKNAKPPILIDLNEFRLSLQLKNKVQLTLHFNSPSRRFYLAVIALVVNEMKKLGKFKSIPLKEHVDRLALLNESIGGAAGSSEKGNLLPRIYRKWKDALPNLEEAPLFKVLGKKKKEDPEGGNGKVYLFTDAEKDAWANLFEYMGSEENVRLKFAADKLGVDLDDIVIIFEESRNEEAWEKFLSSQREKAKSNLDDLTTNNQNHSSFTPADSSIVISEPLNPPGTSPDIPIPSTPLDVPAQPASQVSSPQNRYYFWAGGNHWIVLVILIVLIAGAGALAIWKLNLNSAPVKKASLERMAFPLPDKPSIAVLPLVNMNKDPEQEFFSDGMTEEIITALSQNPNLFVIARTSTFAYKGKSIRIDQVAEELGVRYVLEGSVRRVGDDVRISAQLIDATTGHHLWAERYDSKLRDIFALQDRITEKIVTTLAVKLTAGESGRIAERGTENVAAYEEFLKGWGHFLRFTSEDLAKAVQSLKKAIALDPNYGQAYAALALTYWSGSNSGWVSKGLGIPYFEARLGARKYLKEAMKNPTSIAHLVNSQYYLYRRQHEEAVSELQRALILDPNNPSSNALMGNALFFSGKPREAVDFIERAMRLDPKNPSRYFIFLGGAQFCMGNLEEAVNLVEKALRLNPELTGSAGWLAAAYGVLGRKKEAHAALDIYNKVNTNGPKKIQNIMYFFPFKDRTVADRFAEGLAKAGVQGRPSGYFRAYEENQLSGKEIESLLFGRTIAGPNRLDMDDGQYWFIDRKKNGDSSYRGPEPIPVDTGKTWIEGDIVCMQYQKVLGGLEYCGTVFKNAGGTREGKDEYILCRDQGFMTFSVVR